MAVQDQVDSRPAGPKPADRGTSRPAALGALAAVFRSAYQADPRRLVISMTLLALGAVSGPLTALSVMNLVDAGVAQDSSRAAGWAVASAGFFWASLTMEHLAHIFFFELGDLQAIAAEHELVDLVQGSTGISAQQDPVQADRIALLSRDIELFGEAIPAVLGSLVIVVQLLLTVVLLGSQNVALVVLPLFAVPPVIAGAIAERRRFAAQLGAAERLRRADHLMELSVDPRAGQEIRIFGLKKVLFQRHHDLRAGIRHEMLVTELASTAIRTSGQLIFILGFLLGVYLIVRETVTGSASIGGVVLVLTLAVQMNAQVAGGLAVAKDLQRSLKAFESLDQLRQALAEPARPGDRLLVAPPPRLATGMEIRNLSFSYPSAARAALTDVTLSLPAGVTVAIVGENGAGKSTLIGLLCRLYEPSVGSITVDGTDLTAMDPALWRRSIAVGLQEVHRYELVVRDAIGIGDVTRIQDDGAVAMAVRRAQAEELVDGLPDGLDSFLGTSYRAGTELSGGQWQQLALCRTLMRDEPLVMLLDEPSAALDARREYEAMQRYMERARASALGSGTITVLVSHRMATAVLADLVVVMDSGRVVEVGPPADLLARGGTYRQLFDRQAAGYR